MVNSNSIKAEIKKSYKDLKIISITKHKFGIFTVKVSKQMPKSVKIGFIVGEWDGEKIKLEKVSWA